MGAKIYRELHESAGEDKNLEKVILREAAVEQLRNALDASPGWSNSSQIDSQAAGYKPQEQ
jgi:hypothetical protein